MQSSLFADIPAEPAWWLEYLAQPACYRLPRPYVRRPCAALLELRAAAAAAAPVVVTPGGAVLFVGSDEEWAIFPEW